MSLFERNVILAIIVFSAIGVGTLIFVAFRNTPDQRRLPHRCESIIVNASLLLCELGLIALVALIAD
jgi:hypothetical protein